MPETPWPARGGDTVALSAGRPPAVAPTVALPEPLARPRRRWLWAVAAVALGGGSLAWLGLRERPGSSLPIPVYLTPPAPAPVVPKQVVAPAEVRPPPRPEPAPAIVPEAPVAPPAQHHPEARRASRPKEARRSVQRTANRAPVVD